MARVLFVCLHNAGRSPMSEALFAQAAEGRHEAESAGTTPAARVHPQVVEVMARPGSTSVPALPNDSTASRPNAPTWW